MTMALQQSLDFNAAAKRADAGISRAARKAGKLEHGWVASTVEEVRAFVRAQPATALFTIEDARVACRPMPMGADARAWGQVTRRAKALGIISPTNQMKPAASSNGSPKPLYRRGPHA